jgi:lipoate---protein ligase
LKVIRSNSTVPAYNLALEELLFSESTDNVLLFYINAPSVILGSNQALLNEVNVDFCAEHGLAIVRRKTGGGAVYHDLGNLNFSFMRTDAQREGFMTADFLNPVVAWLAHLGLNVHVGERKDLWTADGFKISGTASLVRKSRVLQHGTLLFDTNQWMLSNALSVSKPDLSVKATPSVRSQTKNLSSYFQSHANFSMTEFVDALLQIVLKHYSVELLTEKDFDQQQISRLMELYVQPEWIAKK